jgi:tight adherence protein C
MDAVIASLLPAGDEAIFMMIGFGGMFSLVLAALGIANAVRGRAAVRRRAADSVAVAAPAAGDVGALDSGKRAAERVLALVSIVVQLDEKQARVLRAQLVQAGFFNPAAPGWFFGARFALAAALAMAGVVAVPMLLPDLTPMTTLFAIAACGIAGYLAPGFYLGRRIGTRTAQVRAGFPDFMDLMVVCSEAGLAMEAALDRVTREIAGAYPALGENLFMTSLEIRAGRTVPDALDRMAKRLGVQEAKSFATLLQQSEELGSSITQSLKVYSDDMRNKRLMRAEEKAYALPAKLVVPLTLFVFPVLLVTLLLPVVIRTMGANF